PVRKLFPGILKYAAAVIVLLGLVFWFNRYFPSREDRGGLVPKNELITIDLGNGKTRTIDPSQSGQLTGVTGNVVAVQQQDLLSYTSDGPGKEEEYNTIKIPYGKRFSVKLSDGTVVHLNAGTELTYPVRFSKQHPRT